MAVQFEMRREDDDEWGDLDGFWKVYGEPIVGTWDMGWKTYIVIPREGGPIDD